MRRFKQYEVLMRDMRNIDWQFRTDQVRYGVWREAMDEMVIWYRANILEMGMMR